MERRCHQHGPCRRVPAVEVQTREGVRVVSRAAPQGEGTVMTGRPRRLANSVVVLPVRVGEIGARPPQLVLDLGSGVRELAGELGVRELHEVRMRDAVRTDVDATLDVTSKLIPAHRHELLRVVTFELGDRQRGAGARERRADEDLDRDSEPLELRKDLRRAAKGIVERHAHAAEAQQRPHLAQKEVGLDREPVLPGRRDRVVAEDERRHLTLAPDEPADEDPDAERKCKEQPAEQDCCSRDS